jgi:N6-L-threonylcarbamoyladenine synthase
VTILGIESSCDETSAAILADGRLRSNIISSQLVHIRYGGVVPELASRAHLQAIVPIIRQALDDAGVALADVDAVAATQGPGLIGSLLVGLNTGKAIASSRGVPFLPIHHIEAHMFSAFLDEDAPEFPFLSLVVSGGHTLLVAVHDVGSYRILGSTIDDAAGEAFDKVGKMLGLGFPGGPAIERIGRGGDPGAIAFPRPLLDSGDFQFSFSGLKTAVLYHLRRRARSIDAALGEQELADICASFQAAVVDVLTGKACAAALRHGFRDIALAGGVSANGILRSTLTERAAAIGARAHLPRPAFTTDNAAMVAMLAHLKLERGAAGTLDAPAFARVEHGTTFRAA